MRAWIAPTVLVATVGVTVVAAGLTGAVELPSAPVRESTTRVSVVCPAFDSATATVKVAAVGIDQPVRSAKVSAPQDTKESTGLAVITNPGEPVRVSVGRSEKFGATTVAAASAGPSRGLAATACLAPQAEFWFAGVDVTEQAQSDLVLVNLDSTDAVVDLVAYGLAGRLAAPRSLTVSGNKVSTISMGVIARRGEPITLKVTTSQGRVAAFVRQLTWDGTKPFGADWVPSGIGPQTEQVLPGVPAGPGRRSLVVTNPGELTADVVIDVLTASGRSELSGAERVAVAPGATAVVDLAPGLAGTPAGLHLTSNVAVAAGVVADNGQALARLDAVATGAAPPVPSDAVWPIAWGKKTAAQLQLVNPGDIEATAEVSLASGISGVPVVTQVTIPPASSVQLPLAKSAVTTVRIRTESTVLRGALMATATLGAVKGMAVLDLVADESRQHHSTVVFDPHLG